MWLNEMYMYHMHGSVMGLTFMIPGIIHVYVSHFQEILRGGHRKCYGHVHQKTSSNWPNCTTKPEFSFK